MNSYNLKGIQETLNKAHPKQIINKVGNLKFIDTFNPQHNLEEELNKWVIDYNEENKHRQISNVKFLGSQCLGYLNI